MLREDEVNEAAVPAGVWESFTQYIHLLGKK